MAPVIVCSYKGSPFLQGCLDSIPSDIPTVVWRGGGYEAGGLRFAQRLQIDSLFFMQDSARIKESQWLRDILSDDKSYCVNNETGPYSMYTGKIRMDVLKQIPVPETRTKMDAVMYELSFGNNYAQIDPNITVLWPELTFENASNAEVFGRPVKVYENDFFLKYKGTWNGAMIESSDTRDKELRERMQSCAFDDT